MKKTLFTIFLFFIFAQTAQSQILISILFGDKLNSESIKFGLDGGINFSDVTNLESSSTASSFNIGFYFDIKLFENSDHWHLHTGVLVKSTMGAEMSPYSLGDEELDALFEGGSVHRKINYFNVPSLIRYKFKSKLFIEFGPMISLRNKAIDEFTNKDDKNTIGYKRDIRDEIKQLDFGFEGGVGYALKSLNGMNVGLRYYQGIINTSTIEVEESQMNKSLFLFASIPIGAGEK